MGWKVSMILINSDKEFDKDKFFESVAYYNLKASKKECFDSVMNPDDDYIYIGKYKGNTIICMQELPMESFDEDVSNAEMKLSKIFPNTDIITFGLHSVVNFWGYSIVNNGKKIRVRAGDCDNGTVIDYGEILEEEKQLFSKSKLDKEGERIFIFEDMPDDEFSEDQVGENFVFDISSKYLGENLDSCDELFDVDFQGYNFSK